MAKESKTLHLNNTAVGAASPTTRTVEIFANWDVAYILEFANWVEAGPFTIVNPVTSVNYGPQDKPFANFSDGDTLTVVKSG